MFVQNFNLNYFLIFKIYMKDPESAEQEEKPNFRFNRFLFFELWSFQCHFVTSSPQFSIKFRLREEGGRLSQLHTYNLLAHQCQRVLRVGYSYVCTAKDVCIIVHSTHDEPTHINLAAKCCLIRQTYFSSNGFWSKAFRPILTKQDWMKWIGQKKLDENSLDENRLDENWAHDTVQKLQMDNNPASHPRIRKNRNIIMSGITNVTAILYFFMYFFYCTIMVVSIILMYR